MYIYFFFKYILFKKMDKKNKLNYSEKAIDEYGNLKNEIIFFPEEINEYTDVKFKYINI
jgi:hypothetical protein